MIEANAGMCQERNYFMPEFPCNKPATTSVKFHGEPALRMCDACADHSIRNRGAENLGPYIQETTA